MIENYKVSKEFLIYRFCYGHMKFRNRGFLKDILKDISNPVFDIIKKEAGTSGMNAYLVGGYVRDLIMKRNNTDIDIVCIGNGIELAENTDLSVQ